MRSWAIKRFVVISVALGLSLSGVWARTSEGEFFCQGMPGKGWAYAAVREIPDGDIQFAIDKWREDGQFFGVHGTALRAGDAWVYKERGRQSYIDDDLTVYDADLKPNEFPTCKLTITWSDSLHLRFEVDPVASCDDHAGAGFYDKSTEFGPSDYDGQLKGELDDHDNFNTGQRCVKPKKRNNSEIQDR